MNAPDAFSRLNLMLAIQRATAAGFPHLAAALPKLLKRQLGR